VAEAAGGDAGRQAWELGCTDPLAARDIGLRLARAGGAAAAEGWLHVALAEARIGDAGVALEALARARSIHAAAADRCGLALCDEVLAIQLCRGGDAAGASRLQAEIDTRQAFPPDPILAFLRHDARAIACSLLEQRDQALRHFHAALEAAIETGWIGAQARAAAQLGAYHRALFNLDHARRLCEQALRLAREAGAPQLVGLAASNLIRIYHANGEPLLARDMTEFMLTRGDELVPDAKQRHALPLALGHLGVGDLDAAQAWLDARAGASDGEDFALRTWLECRCLLARGDAPAARKRAECVPQQPTGGEPRAEACDSMQVQLVLADACEACGDTAAALAHLRQTHGLYQQLVGRGARARSIALEFRLETVLSRWEPGQPQHARLLVEDDNRRLAELNAALQTQITETEMLHAQLREQALRDPLTGLHNRRYLFEIAPGLLELARRQASPLCVVLIDLDHFKLLNDTYGHHAGDLVLQRFADLMTTMLRRSDVICRHGGEEFVAVMPDIDGDGAQAMLGRLLEAFQSRPPEPGRRRPPSGSFSAGIALFPNHGHTLEQLLSRADRALYAAKNHGRARIEQAPRSGFGSWA
jgi:diguanylate cyclase (GGDEF)-like protein